MADQHNDFCDCRVIHLQSIENAKQRTLSADKIEQLSHLFKAVADPGRIKILKALEYEEMCVCDLAAFLSVSESAVSHQLRTLRQLQLVANRRKGPVLYYRLHKKIASQLLDLGIKYIDG